MSIPTGFPPTNGRDGWANFDQATGFERELLDILRFMRDTRNRRLVWITTDVHFAEVFRYRPFDGRPGLHGSRARHGPAERGHLPEPRLRPDAQSRALFFYGPASAGAVTTWEEAKRWFNFGTLVVQDDGTLTAGVVNTAGDDRVLARARVVAVERERGAPHAPRSRFSAVASASGRHRSVRVVLPETELVALRVLADREPAHARDRHGSSGFTAELLHAGGACVDVVDVEVDARSALVGRRPRRSRRRSSRRTASCGTRTASLRRPATPSRRAPPQNSRAFAVSPAGISR